MVKTTIKITKIADIKALVVEANKLPYDVDISSGRLVVDAKSIMGVFSLDLSSPVEVQVHADKETAKEFLSFLEGFSE